MTFLIFVEINLYFIIMINHIVIIIISCDNNVISTKLEMN